MNIWTHLVGLMYFLYLLYEDNFVFLPDHGSDIGDHITFIFFDFCCMVCEYQMDVLLKDLRRNAGGQVITD